MTKGEIIDRREYLTADGYQLIKDSVMRVHGIELTRRTVDAYIRSEPVHRTGERRRDRYGIQALFKAVTDAEKELRTALQHIELQKITA